MSLEDHDTLMDPRVLDAALPRPDFDHASMQLSYTLVDDATGEEHAFTLPARFEVCPLCRGHGTHVAPGVDACGLTDSQMHDDPDFAQAYRRGRFDVTCVRCEGKRVVGAPDEAVLSEHERGLLARWNAELDARRAYARQCALERAMGC